MTAPYISIFENRHRIDLAVLSENDSVVDYCQRVGDYNPSNPQHYLTDACLPYPFAAAPELLAALKELVAYDDGSNEPEDYGYELLQRCKAAIAKAEGRSE